MPEPRRWSLEELRRDANESTERFRAGRLRDPLRELYRQTFDSFREIFRDLVPQLAYLSGSEGPSRIADLFASPENQAAVRYLTAPPTSEDDLKTLANTSLAARVLAKDRDAARRVRDVIMASLDDRRFPWVHRGTVPTDVELEAAIVASAGLIAAKRIETARRTDAQKIQEELVKSQLHSSGFVEVRRRPIRQPHQAPAPGEFCSESVFGPTRADIIVRLHDQRIMPIECKVSNSAVNSFKRVNHEAANKATQWLTAFGRSTTVPAAVLSGVFNPENLVVAQDAGLAIFWAHRLEDLAEFLAAAR